ncbi:MAG: DNA repair protein RecO, partial [bacterium]|nr:DNA repair protein RecO [bacterium]
MSVTFHTTAFVLRTINQGEHDRRAHLYSLDRGKLDVFIKSARKFASKLTPHVEPLTIVDCYVARGRIDHLAGVERLDRFSGVRGSLPRFAAAAWAAETVDLLTKWDHADPRIFHLLSSWCVFIDQLSTDRVSERLRLKFFLTLLSYLGYGLQWHACIKCRVSAHDYWAVQPTEGGVICGTCTADPLFSLAITNR